MPQSDPNQPDWNWYGKHKQEIDEMARDTLEKGTLQDMGHPPGPTLDISAKAICCILHKNPQLGTDGCNPATGKPLTGSEKRRQRRFDKDRPPDNIIDIEGVEGKDFKVILKEDYVPPKSAKYIKNGKEMPENWEPIRFEGETKPVPSIENGGSEIT